MMSNHIVTTESPVAVTTEAAAEPTLVLRGHVGDALDGYSQSRTIVDGAHHTIQWAPGTVDNEYMGKKKSKCCCIYEKPRNWDDPSSSSDSDSESDSPNPKKCTEHCRGHTKHCYTKKAAAKLTTDRVSATEQDPGGPSQSPPDPKSERS